ncbi:hypothetical protein PG984_004926 [Apiospora sp. TS-2023a]
MRQRVLALWLKIAFTFTAIRCGSTDDADNRFTWIHPGMGETLWIGTQYRLQWKGIKSDDPVSIELFATNGPAVTIATNVTIQAGACEWNIDSTIQPHDDYYLYLKDERTSRMTTSVGPFLINASEGVGQAAKLNATSSTSSPSLSASSPLTSNGQTSSSTPQMSQDDLMTSSDISTRIAIMTPVWFSSHASLLYSSTFISSSASSPTSTPSTQSPSPEPASKPSTEYITAIALGSIACIAIALNIGWLVLRLRRRRREKVEKGDKDDDTSAQKNRSNRRSKTDHRAEVASYSKRQTGIPELEADLAPAVAAVKPGVCYELEALEKPLELRASVATWLSSRRAGGRPWSRSSRGPPHASSTNS